MSTIALGICGCACITPPSSECDPQLLTIPDYNDASFDLSYCEGTILSDNPAWDGVGPLEIRFSGEQYLWACTWSYTDDTVSVDGRLGVLAAVFLAELPEDPGNATAILEISILRPGGPTGYTTQLVWAGNGGVVATSLPLSTGAWNPVRTYTRYVGPSGEPSGYSCSPGPLTMTIAEYIPPP